MIGAATEDRRLVLVQFAAAVGEYGRTLNQARPVLSGADEFADEISLPNAQFERKMQCPIQGKIPPIAG
jgi:hypothetical protein